MVVAPFEKKLIRHRKKIMSRAVAAHVQQHGLVTTYGLTTYQPTSISGKSKSNASFQRSLPPTPSLVPPLLPAPPPLSSFVTSFPRVTSSSIPVCTISIDAISPQIVADFELLRNESGEFRFVYRAADSQFYDVSYYNASLRRTVPLGRFQDAAVAALAHAIARDDGSRDTCRIVPHAAQEYIESLFTRVEVDENGAVEAVGRAVDDGPSLMEAEIDFDELFKMC